MHVARGKRNALLHAILHQIRGVVETNLTSQIGYKIFISCFDETVQQQFLRLSLIPIQIGGDSPAGEGAVTCATCMTNKARYMVYRCGHCCLCGACVIQHRLISQQHNPDDKIRCPVCRGVVQDYLEDHDMDSDAVRGTCILMCPYQEMELRQREGLIHVLESRRGGSGGRGTRLTADRRRMVKMFTRSAAGKDLLQPDQLRPPPILRRTIIYLLSSVVSESELPWTTVYFFVSDRLRAVRQDMVVQQTPPHMCCNILEPIVRFHAYSSYRLCEEPIDAFDPHLNSTQLNECLKQLLVCYDSEGDGGERLSVTRDQVEALYGLLHLGNVEAIYRLLSIDPPSNSQSRIALRMSVAHFCNDYITVFRQFRRLSPLLACVAAQHLPQIRRKTLSIMNSAYSSKNLRYPLPNLTSLLLCSDDGEAVEECKHYGLSVDEDEVHFLKGTFDNCAKERPPKKLNFLDDNLSNIPLPDLLLSAESES